MPEKLSVACTEERSDGWGSVRPRLMHNVAAWPFFRHDEPRHDIYIVGNREIDRYISVPAPKLPTVLKILSSFDGCNSIHEIQKRFNIEEGKYVNLRALYRQLCEAGLIAHPVPAQATKGNIERASIRLLRVNVERIFIWLSFYSRRFFPWTILAMGFLVAVATPLAIVHHKALLSPVKSAWDVATQRKELCCYAVLLLLSVILHEMAHGVAGCRYGLYAKRFEAALYLGLVPIVYLRIPGLYTLPARERVMVWSAGVYWNLTFASFSVIMFHWLPYWHELWPVLACANYSMAIVNLIPFLPTDGYFIASTLLKTHNIRGNTWKALAKGVKGRPSSWSGAMLTYFIFTVAIIGLTIWRDIGWFHRLRTHSIALEYLGLLLFALPSLVLLYRGLIRQRVHRSGSQQ